MRINNLATQDMLSGNPMHLELFHLKLRDVHHVGTMKACTKIRSEPSSSWGDISVQRWNDCRNGRPWSHSTVGLKYLRRYKLNSSIHFLEPTPRGRINIKHRATRRYVRRDESSGLEVSPHYNPPVTRMPSGSD